MEITLRIDEAIKICQDALTAHVVSKGMNPDKEILVSRWYLQTRSNRINFRGHGYESASPDTVLVDIVDPKDLSYKDLQQYVKTLGLKAHGSRGILMDRIRENGKETRTTGESESSSSSTKVNEEIGRKDIVETPVEDVPRE